MASFVCWKGQGKKRLGSLLIILLVVPGVIILSQSSSAYAQTLEWQKTLNHWKVSGVLETDCTDFGEAIAAGPDGVYIVGQSQYDNPWIGGDPLIIDSFYAKYDFNGTLVSDHILFDWWGKQNGADMVLVDGTNVYIAGWIQGDQYTEKSSYLSFLNESESAYPSDPMYGGTIWGGNQSDSESIASMATYGGELYVVLHSNHIRRNIWGGISDAWNEVRILKFSSNLTKIWEKSVNFLPHTLNVGAIAVDSSGIHLGGEFERTLYGVSGNYNLVKLDFDCNFLWKANYNSEPNVALLSFNMALNNGYIYMTGEKILVNPDGTYIPLETISYYLAKYDASVGKLVWSVVSKNPGGDYIAVGSSGIYLASTISAVSPTDMDVSLVKVDFSGNYLWNKTWGGTDDDYVLGITATGDNAYLTGLTWSYAGASNKGDAFLLKYGELDNTRPATYLTVGEPEQIDDANTYVTSNTPLMLTAEDNLDGSGVAFTAYHVTNSTYGTGWIDYHMPFYLVGLSDGEYSIAYNSTDNAGNMEFTNNARLVLDNSAPTTTLVIGQPKYISDVTYVTRDTTFTLQATDAGSGVKITTYRIYNTTYNTGWQNYETPIKLISMTDGNYTVEYRSTDKVENTETTHTTRIAVFSWSYVFEDTNGRGTSLKINLANNFFQFTALARDFGVRKATFLQLFGKAIIISHRDNQLRLVTLALDTKLDYCYANAWDLQNGKGYLLIDKVGIE